MGLSYSTIIEVRLDGKLIGHIREVAGGWAYFPRRGKLHGDKYATLAACKLSLEG